VHPHPASTSKGDNYKSQKSEKKSILVLTKPSRYRSAAIPLAGPALSASNNTAEHPPTAANEKEKRERGKDKNQKIYGKPNKVLAAQPI